MACRRGSLDLVGDAIVAALGDRRDQHILIRFIGKL
jgi:hypothetical protein